MFKSFWLGTHLDDFLFKGYDLVSIWGLLATCLGASSLAILYEGGRIYKVHLKSRIIAGNDEVIDASTDTATLMNPKSSAPSSRMDRFCHAAKFALLSVGHDFVGYILMLSVMTFNLAIAIAVWLGAGIGYFIFASNISISNSAKVKQKCEQSVENERSSPYTLHEGPAMVSAHPTENVGIGGTIWSSEISQQPLNLENQDVNYSHDDSPDHSQIDGCFLTATAIVHREPSS